MFAGLSQDIRYALRGFAKSPLFLAVAVGSLGLGIGSNAAIFSLVDQLLFRPLPVAAPDRLVMLDLPGGRVGSTFTDFAFSNKMYRRLREEQSSFEALLATYRDQANVSFRGRTETAPVLVVSGNYFSGLGLSARFGRLLGPEDDQKKNAHQVVVLSHGYFSRRFGGDRTIVGQTIRINARPYEVIGVAPEGFTGLELDAAAALYVPMAQKTAITATWDGMEDPNFYFLHVFGVLKPGVSATQAKANLDALVAPMIEDELKAFPGMPARGQSRFRAKRFVLNPAGTPLIENRKTITPALYALIGVVGFVLLIACANVANLLIARASTREKEVAVRMAIGAGSGRLVRQMLVESTLLALIGGAFGLLLSIWILDGILALQPVDGAEEVFLRARPDWRVGLFCFGVSLLTGLLFGLAPALRGAHKKIVESLKENAGGLVAGAAQGLLRRGLVVAQVSISLVLLIAAGLFLKSLMNLQGQNPGFDPDYLLGFRIDPSLNGYEKDRALAFLGRFAKDVEALPGVKDVTLASVPLLSNSVNMATMSVEGITKTEGRDMNSRINSVGPGFFRTLGMPVLSGREFQENDLPNSLKVAVVNEEFAKEYFGGQAIGKRIGFGRNKDNTPRLTMEIVGVVRDGKHSNMREAKPVRFVYTPYTQDENVEGMTFYIRSQAAPERLVAEIRSALTRVDDSLAMHRIQTMEKTIERSLILERMLSVLCTSFGLLATVLSGIGLYGVISYNVGRRTREIGIRLALGADRRRVVRLILEEAGKMLAIGLFLGLPAAYGLGRFIESQLWGVKNGDPAVMVLASLFLGCIGLLAGFVPAWRASRVDPMTALRCD